MATETTRQFTNPELPGYVGFANLPNQVHRKSVKKGFEFTLMVVGESGLGKSTLIDSLFLTDLYPERLIPDAGEKVKQTVKLDASTVEIEERGVKLRLTVVDTPGFGDGIDNSNCFNSIIQYIDDQFERFLRDESGLNRRNIVDNRVHCCFYFISPYGHGLKPLDVEFMRQLHHKVNIVPVIAKADILTRKEVMQIKKKIMEEIEENGIRVYPLPDCDSDEDDDYKEQVKQLKEAVPFAVCGSTQMVEVKGKKVRGRIYPWGVVEVENPEHCDFIKLRTMLITHMQDLQEVTQDLHYENYRSERLASKPAPQRKPSFWGLSNYVAIWFCLEIHRLQTTAAGVFISNTFFSSFFLILSASLINDFFTASTWLLVFLNFFQVLLYSVSTSFFLFIHLLYSCIKPQYLSAYIFFHSS